MDHLSITVDRRSRVRPPFPFLALLLLGLPENTGRGIARRRWSDEPAFGVGRHLLQMVHRTLRRRHGICRPDQLRLHPAGYFFLKIGCCTRHRSEEHTSELQSLMRISYAVFCLKKKKKCNRTRQKKQLIPRNINKQKIKADCNEQ